MYHASGRTLAKVLLRALGILALDRLTHRMSRGISKSATDFRIRGRAIGGKWQIGPFSTDSQSRTADLGRIGPTQSCSVDNEMI